MYNGVVGFCWVSGLYKSTIHTHTLSFHPKSDISIMCGAKSAKVNLVTKTVAKLLA